MRLTIINGSQRQPSQSGRVARFLAQEAERQGHFAQLEVVDLAELQLPFWDGDSQESKGADWQLLEPKLAASDAYILITPEWSGMATPLLKQFLMNASVPVTGHKPALLVSVSAGINGVFPLGELMQSGNKNNKLVFIPANIIVRDVDEMLHPQPREAQLPHDIAIRERIDASLELLGHYARALQPLKEYRDPFRYGM
ncbi:NAD(P)H-dependent oxidoreductase [Shewanella cyperi]|uniref:NAD(P)H-dependent oxidoreductase n=1 Tax=Shewanella cyperi TaxID=2814292 RepID=A0A974XUV4_9GAMM|nr:NAD(P)H-dependent oxidoreductase [Shewanella cyperi]QSX30714.1 NAD(P)H-dependent oxidoreductase [Shewanella cyperi]